MKISEEVYIHGYIDEIRKDTVIIRNEGGYFGTVPSEIKSPEQSCEDCVSRQAVLDCLTATGLKKFDFILDAREKVNNLPPVTPTRKVGKWIKTGGSFRCSECMSMPEFKDIRTLKYCPNCGAEMVGVEND